MIYRGGPGSTSAATVNVAKTGEISLLSGLMDVGEGATTVLPQMAAEILGVDADDIDTVFGDSSSTPEAPITAGSTATFSTGSALVRAAAEVRRQLLDLASDGLEAPVMELDIRDGRIFVTDDPSRSMAPDRRGRPYGRRCHHRGGHYSRPGQRGLHRQLLRRSFLRDGSGHRYWPGAGCPVRGGPGFGSHNEPANGLEPGRGRYFPDAGVCLSEELVTDGPTA